jgi:hypothetical protein
MKIDEIKSAYELVADAVETYKQEGRQVPDSVFERVLNLWKETIDLYKADAAQTFYVYEFDGEQTAVNKEGTELWPFFREVAAIIAMSDCSEQEIVKIVFQGKEFRYAGWAPGMEYTFIDNTDPENTYTTYMEHLDH